MKEFTGDLWQEREPDGRIKIGFAKRYIDDVLGECFHVMQADTREVKKGGPLMVIETNDGLTSLKSPLTGTILNFNSKARNFPDRLSEDDVIMEVVPEGVKIAAKEKVKKPETGTGNWLNLQDVFQVNVDLFNQPVQVDRQAAELRVQGILDQLRDERADRAEMLRQAGHFARAVRRPR